MKLLTLCILSCLVANVHASFYSVTVDPGIGVGLIGASGDPEAAPVVVPEFSSSLLVLHGPTLIAERGTTFYDLILTDFSFKWLNPNVGGSFTINVRSTTPVDFPAAWATLLIDGDVVTSNPNGIDVGASLWATSLDQPNPYGIIMFSLGLHVDAATGNFSADESRLPFFPGPVDQVFMSLTVSGLQYGDSVEMPGSLGLRFLPTPVPEASTCLAGLLMVIPLALQLFGRRGSSPNLR
jgi:hypothetical protein